MTFLPALEPLDVAPMDLDLSSGVVDAFRNGAPAWFGAQMGEMILADLEAVVVYEATPDDDWQLHVEDSLDGRVFQRQGPGRWVAVRRLAGFA
jgi:hypothetical protein